MIVRVLIADDQEPVRAALRALIAGADELELVGEATDADEAIALAARYAPHVALLDYKMPQGGGARAAQQIRRLSPRTQIVALSAYDDRGSVFEMLRAGAVGYLVKGASESEILEAIVHAARGEGRLSSAVTGDVVRELGDQLERRSEAERVEQQRADRVRRALKPGAVGLVFQPIFELATGDIAGYEALARFRLEPEKSPDWWFDEAATVGLQEELEEVTVGLACTALDWLGPETFLAVNVAPGSLLSPAIQAHLNTMRLNQLVVELTEHARVEDYEALNEHLLELRMRGMRLAVDDAGAGFASLRHVLRLAPDVLKIDGAVVRGIHMDPAPRALTAALVVFARELGIDVAAEGIERSETLDALKELGVRYGQGYFLGMPGGLPNAPAGMPGTETHPRRGETW